MSNLKLWDAVKKTDPAYTKPASKGQFNFTSVAPMYQNMKATEQFGIQGIGWGVVVGSEVFTEKEYGTTTIISYDAVLFFNVDGVRGEIPIHASEKSCYMTNGYKGKEGYMKIDDEVRKKVVTNAKTKGLSELGFSADIFMGQFDDPNYVDYLNFEISLEKADDREAETKGKIEEFNDWCKKESDCYSAIKNKRTLDLLLGGHKQKLQGRCRLLNLDEAAYTKGFTKAYEDQLNIISGDKK
jgi:hypothetical protein